MNLSRSLVITIILLAYTLPAFADVPQPLAEKWVTRIAGAPGFADIPSAIATDSHGHVYIAGYIGTTVRDYKATVAKLDGTNGAVLWRWESSFVTGDDTPNGATSRRCRVAVGPDDDPVAVFDDEGLMKFHSADGALSWAVSFLGADSGVALGHALDLDSAGDAIVVGSSSRSPWKAVAAKYRSTDGQRLWLQAPGGVSAGLMRAVKADPAGDIFMSGSSSNGTHQFTAKLSGQNGVPIWTAAIPGPNSQGGRIILLDDFGGVAVATFDDEIFRYRAADGVLLWQRSNLGGPYGFAVDSSGDYYLSTGNITIDFQGTSIVRKIDGATGATIWTLNRSLGFVMNLAVRGNEVLAMGNNGPNIQLSALEPQTGVLRWSQQYDSGGRDYATSSSRALTLMARQPDDGVVITGVATPSEPSKFDMVAIRYAPGPSVGNLATQWVLPSSARLTAKAAGNGVSGRIHFEYGLTTAYGSSTPSFDLPVSSSLAPYAINIEGLAENTLYHARAVAEGEIGTTTSPDSVFTTGWDANGNKLPDEWELAKWGNTSRRFATDDEDRDGLKNLLEYALDHEPRVPDSASPVAVVLDDGHLAVTLTKRPHVNYVVEVSGDVKTWIPATVVAENEVTLTARDSLSSSAASSRFLRVRVTPQ